MEINNIFKIGIIGVFAMAVIMVAIVWGSSTGLFGSKVGSNTNNIQLNPQTQPISPSGTCGLSGSGGECGGTNSAGTKTVQIANPQVQTNTTIGAESEVQEINMTVDGGWLPSSFVVKTGVPVKWNVYVEQFGGCINGLSAPDLSINYRFQQVGETKTFEFTPTKAGIIYFSCLMNMTRGQIIVRDDVTVSDASATNIAATTAATNNPRTKTGGCGCGG